ncbi:nucleoside monophosphate kinase [Candidatus Peregrinibacteria bacterium]|nr:nucleoside monophosphate kinase [Candidatus Peregrinibacteria bacterium]
MDYTLFGIQGSGKGTQGKILGEKIGAAYFETGGELRRLAKEDSELGKKVKSIIEAGRLVPNEVVMEIVENFIKHLQKPEQPIVFDGIPRNGRQNDSLEALLKKNGREYTGIYFELSREEAENRLVKRRICSKCKTVFPAFYSEKDCEKCHGKLVTRADDNADSIRTRIEIFYKETLPVIESWDKNGRMIKVNGVGKIESVTQELLSKI